MTSFLQDKQLTIALTGEIDHHSAKKTMEQIGEKIDLYMPNLCILDFKTVSFMDSSGIAIVINTLRRMREIGGQIRLNNVPPQPLKVLKTAGIERITTIEPREVTV